MAYLEIWKGTFQVYIFRSFQILAYSLQLISVQFFHIQRCPGVGVPARYAPGPSNQIGNWYSYGYKETMVWTVNSRPTRYEPTRSAMQTSICQNSTTTIRHSWQSRATITDGNECRRTFCCLHWEIRTHHTSSTRCASLVAGLQGNSVQGRIAGFRLCSGYEAVVFHAPLCLCSRVWQHCPVQSSFCSTRRLVRRSWEQGVSASLLLFVELIADWALLDICQPWYLQV